MKGGINECVIPIPDAAVITVSIMAAITLFITIAVIVVSLLSESITVTLATFVITIIIATTTSLSSQTIFAAAVKNNERNNSFQSFLKPQIAAVFFIWMSREINAQTCHSTIHTIRLKQIMRRKVMYERK